MDEPTAIRFLAGHTAIVKQIAAAEGMGVSAWIRREVEREITRREGQCSHCGQQIPRPAGGAADETRALKPAEECACGHGPGAHDLDDGPCVDCACREYRPVDLRGEVPF